MISKLITFFVMIILATNVFAQQSSGGNSVYIDQTAADGSTLAITQTGSGNVVGDPTSLISPAFVIDGNNMDLTILQDGMNNSVTGNFIGGDSTATITQTGSGNSTVLDQGNFGTGAGNLNVSLIGDNNTSALHMGTTANAGNYNYSLTVTGDTNAITSTLNSKYITNTIVLTGNSNTLTTTQSGVNGTSLIPGHSITSTIIGNSNTASITQNGTTTPNAVTLNVTGSNTSTTIIQH
jgi:hypothetical protein